jgi:hypothetical protein
MKAWNIITHSLRQVFGNFPAALRVSAILFLVQTLVAATLIGDPTLLEAQIKAGTISYASIAIALLIAIICSLWVAVGWHRYVLTNEQPGLLPRFHGDRMLEYFGFGILIALMVILPITALTIIAGIVLHSISFTLVATFLPIILGVALGYLLLRCGTMLPGAALQKGVPVTLGWKATKGASGTFIALAIMLFLAQIMLAAIGSAVTAAIPIAVLPVAVLTQWPVQMVGLSVLTTLYGHYIEHRPLA